MLSSLAVATLMWSQVMARVFRDEDKVVQDAGGSLQQMPVRKEQTGMGWLKHLRLQCHLVEASCLGV